MNKFAAIAKKETTLSPVMEGREKVTMDDVMRNYRDGVTVTEFDFITITDPKKGEVTFPVLAFAEAPDKCFFGGAVMTRICKEWAAAYNGDIEAASGDLAKCGGVKLRFTSKKTRTGNNVTGVEVISG